MSLYSTRCIRGYALSPDPKIWPDREPINKHGYNRFNKINATGRDKRYHDRLVARASWWTKLKQWVGKILRHPSGAQYRVHEDGSFRRVK